MNAPIGSTDPRKVPVVIYTTMERRAELLRAAHCRETELKGEIERLGELMVRDRKDVIPLLEGYRESLQVLMDAVSDMWHGSPRA